MPHYLNRRTALQTGIAGGSLLGVGDLGFLSTLRPVSGEEQQPAGSIVRLDSGIEPIVRLIEETPRERLLEEVAHRIKQGLSYREILAALQLAGVKNIEPRPSVGFKFHAVLVVNSAHLASMSSPPEHRWLPIFWALDYYKSAAARDVRERGDWTMDAIDDSHLPPVEKAKAELISALDHWNVETADAAIAGLARTAGINDIYETLFHYGARDFRSIGHKAIFVANSYRTLNAIGVQHAEPILRSLVYAMLAHEGGNPSERDAEADRPYRRNQELVNKIRDDWQAGKLDKKATEALLQTIRSGSNNDACDHVVELLNSGVAPQSVYDALHLGATELLMRQPGIVALHAVTTTNALYYGFKTCAKDANRRMILLQNAAFLPMFREAMRGRGNVKDVSLADLDAGLSLEKQPIESIFAELRSSPMSAAQQAYAFLQNPESATQRAGDLIDAARLLVFFKGNDAHDYKFSSAIMEDFHHVSAPFRAQYLAGNLFKLRSSADSDNQLVERTRAALG